MIEPGSEDPPQTIDLTPLIPANAQPHDVILDAHGNYAYVTVFTEDESDLLLKFDTQNFSVVGSADIGKDAHVSLAPEHNLLYVASQDSSRIDILIDAAATWTMSVRLISPTPHGIIHSVDGRYLYVTNISEGGDHAIFTIDTVTNQVVGDLDGVDVPFAVPHNVAVTNDGQGLFLTHSGPTANATTFLSLEDPTTPTWQSSVNGQGTNPFGLTAVHASLDDLIVKGGANNIIKSGAGNDTVFGGGGNDQISGQSGNDKLFGESGHDDIRGNNGDDILIGGVRNDTLRGGNGDDLLIGVEVDSLTPGAGEVDIYRGGAGADTFVLGDALAVHYDDGDGTSLGLNDYGWIRDFNRLDGDVIRLHGSAEDYSVGIANRQASIFYKFELIGVVDNVGSLDLNSTAFEYAALPTTEDESLT
ncbi:MAG: YncE family protein [Acaryochloridaceae cyanobacterium RL_2_7]|nr:YncE family protein [Acaryochloridaceae cyanobacterium RL_2_7]